MLQRLSIRNYALIQELTIDLRSGLTIITGETGAGKSIVLGALSMLLGERADLSVLRDSSKKCIVEAAFNTEDYDLHDFFLEHDLDEEAICMLRREINPAGKSRAFINDTPVNLSQLKELGSRLIDIHSQHDTLLLSNSHFQLQLLDAPAMNSSNLKKYQGLFSGWKNKQKELQAIKATEQRLKDELDFFEFQLHELNQANIKAGEFETLENDFKRLSHAEEIKNQFQAALITLDQEEYSILPLFKSLQQSLQQAARFSVAAEELVKRVSSAQLELKDIYAELENQQQALSADPNQLEIISQRLDLINHLLHKHRITDADELLVLKEKFSSNILQAETASSQVEQLESELIAIEQELRELATGISAQRKKVIPEIVRQTEVLLGRLGMPKSKLEIILQTKDQPGFYGTDAVSIHFSANPGSLVQEISRVASGGEFSRLMLCLKKIIATSVALPTIIFDEIDTGVSGSIADSMGDILREMGETIQVIAITHLPQIASKGNDHLKVLKTSSGKETVSTLQRMNETERVDEIAGMLSGKELSEAAIMNARSLLGIGN
jgi:DNA repair protein RecN (Recombination protein N)